MELNTYIQNNSLLLFCSYGAITEINERSTNQTRFNRTALRKAGWGSVKGSRLRLEFPITKGRLIGQNRRATPLFCRLCSRV